MTTLRKCQPSSSPRRRGPRGLAIPTGNSCPPRPGAAGRSVEGDGLSRAESGAFPCFGHRGAGEGHGGPGPTLCGPWRWASVASAEAMVPEPTQCHLRAHWALRPDAAAAAGLPLRRLSRCGSRGAERRADSPTVNLLLASAPPHGDRAALFAASAV